MAPKRKRAVWERRAAANESSFSDCPACEMKVVSYLINHHLDWDCPALIRRIKQLPTASAAQVTEQLFSPELLCNREPHYDCPDFKAQAQDSLFVLSTEAKLHCSPIHDYVTSYKAGTEFGVYCDGDKYVRVEEDLNISYSETDSHGLQRGPHIGEKDHLDRHDNRSDASEQCLKIHNGSPKPNDPHDWHDMGSDVNKQCLEIHKGLVKPTDELDSHARSSFVWSPGRGHSSIEANTSSSECAKGDSWQLITTSIPPKAPKGHYVFENFISEKEEQDILLYLDTDFKNPWKSSTFNGLQTGKAYGLSIDLKKRCVRPAIFEMPKVLVPVIERMRTTVPILKDFWPNETNAIDYHKNKGHWLKPHVDDRQLSGTIVVNLSLCGDCKMTYEREKGPRESYKVLLRRRCIQVLTGESRYNFTHSIRNEDLLHPRRVSMTFRQSVNA